MLRCIPVEVQAARIPLNRSCCCCCCASVGLGRLAEAVTEEVWRRSRSAPDNPSVEGRSPKRTPAKAARAKPDRAATVTAGQERLILAAFDAGLGPAAIAKEFRVSRPTVQRVITDAQRDRRRTER